MIRSLFAILLLLLPGFAQAELRGHGGPVRALAISADGRLAVSGSFDQSAIVWDLERGEALQVLRFHDGAVNAVAALPDGRFASAGEDGRIALWRFGRPEPEAVIEAHGGPIAGLSLSLDGAWLASASWDGTARLTPLAGGDARVLAGHTGPVNAVAFLPDGRPVTAGYDGTVRIWSQTGDAAVRQLPAPLNAVAAFADGDLVVAGADGVVRVLRDDGVRSQIELGPRPVIALAVSTDGAHVAAATIGGTVSVIGRADNRVLFSLVGPGLPVWSVAFRSGAEELVTGGGDRLVRRWSLRNGEHLGAVLISRPADVMAGLQGERGAEVFQACAACHTLTPDGGNRAGPTLHGIFGRRIATAPGYNFSPSLKSLDIVWTAETIARLFEVGPARYTPGTKMPEQVITRAEDREALVRFLERVTR